jgi:hypothetical protein
MNPTVNKTMPSTALPAMSVGLNPPRVDVVVVGRRVVVVVVPVVEVVVEVVLVVVVVDVVDVVVEVVVLGVIDASSYI